MFCNVQLVWEARCCIAVYTVQMYSVSAQCLVFSVQCIAYSVECTLCSVSVSAECEWEMYSVPSERWWIGYIAGTCLCVRVLHSYHSTMYMWVQSVPSVRWWTGYIAQLCMLHATVCFFFIILSLCSVCVCVRVLLLHHSSVYYTVCSVCVWASLTSFQCVVCMELLLHHSSVQCVSELLLYHSSTG